MEPLTVAEYIGNLNKATDPFAATDYYHWLYHNTTGHRIFDRLLYLGVRCKDARDWGCVPSGLTEFVATTLSHIQDHFDWAYHHDCLADPIHLEN